MPPYSTSACVRSGYVAANRIDIGAPSEIPMSTARSRAHGIHDGTHVVHALLERNGCDVAVGEPEPALVEADQPAERCQPAEEPRDGRVFPLDVEVAREPLNEHQVEVSLADDLVRNVHVSALCVLHRRMRDHGLEGY